MLRLARPCGAAVLMIMVGGLLIWRFGFHSFPVGLIASWLISASPIIFMMGVWEIIQEYRTRRLIEFQRQFRELNNG